MSSRSRWLIFLVSTPLVVIAAVGGLLGASRAVPAQTFSHLRVFDDVLGLIRTNYVEPVDMDKVLEGAMRGLAEGLDPASAYLTPDEVKLVDAGTALPAGDVGITVSRQFYLRIVGVRDGSPASHAGLRTGDFIRGIDGKSTREVSAWSGARLLHGAPGSKVQLTVLRGSAAEPHVVDLVREAPKGDIVTSKRLPSGDGYVRVVSFGTGAAAAIRKQIDALHQAGVTDAVIDLRGVADGVPDEGIAAARAFVKTGTLATLAGRGADRKVIAAATGDGAVTMPVVLLVSNGTGNAAEVFASALSGNRRADLVGEPTAGLAAVQHLVRLPENRGLWMTYQRYLTNDGKPIHEHGLPPTIGVEEPNIAFGETPPTGDDMLDKAVAHLKQKKAA